MSSGTDIAKTIAVAGAIGGSADNNGFKASIGSAIVDHLLKTKAKVIALVRISSVDLPQVTELKKKGVQIAVIDYSDPSSVESALKGADIVVSALSGGGLKLQPALADASKAAGVRVFLPSEFGPDSTIHPKDSPMYGKREFQLYLDSIGLPFISIFNGLISDFINLFLKVDDGQVEIVGSDDPLIDFTSIKDIALFVAHVLTAIPISDLAGRTFRLSGCRTSLIDLVPYLEKKQPPASPKIQVVRISIEEALHRFRVSGDLLSLIRATWAEGEGVVGTDEQIEETREAFSEWNPLSVEKFI